jgi:hypothetical protein
MDRALRELERAARVDPDARARLDHALDRIGRQALAFRGPDPVPVRAPVARRRDTCPRLINEKLGNTRHRTQCSASADGQARRVERRARRQGRAQCAEGLAEWLEDRGRTFP